MNDIDNQSQDKETQTDQVDSAVNEQLIDQIQDGQQEIDKSETPTQRPYMPLVGAHHPPSDKDTDPVDDSKPPPKDDPAYMYLNLEPNEQIMRVVRHHWAGFLSTAFMIFWMFVIPLVIVIIINIATHGLLSRFGNITIMIVSAYLLFMLTFLMGEWINFYYDVVIITNRRIININQVGLLSRQTSEVSIMQIQNVSADIDGILRSILDFGKISVETAGEGTSDEPVLHHGVEGYFTIDDIPSPNKIARLILDLHRQSVER